MNTNILEELSKIADKLNGCEQVVICRDGRADVLTSEQVKMLVTALHAFTKPNTEARDYSVTDPDMGLPDEGGVK